MRVCETLDDDAQWAVEHTGITWKAPKATRFWDPDEINTQLEATAFPVSGILDGRTGGGEAGVQIVFCSSRSEFLLLLNSFKRVFVSLSLCAVLLLFCMFSSVEESPALLITSTIITYTRHLFSKLEDRS